MMWIWEESGSEFLEHLYGMINDLKGLLDKEVDFIEYRHFRNPYFREEVEKTKVLIFEYSKEPEKVNLPLYANAYNGR